MLPDLDIVLVMTVNPGFGGQSFIPSALGKLRRLYRTIDDNGYAVQLEVDGGVKADDTARDSVVAGAGILVAGTCDIQPRSVGGGGYGRLEGHGFRSVSGKRLGANTFAPDAYPDPAL